MRSILYISFAEQIYQLRWRSVEPWIRQFMPMVECTVHVINIIWIKKAMLMIIVWFSIVKYLSWATSQVCVSKLLIVLSNTAAIYRFVLLVILTLIVLCPAAHCQACIDITFAIHMMEHVIICELKISVRLRNIIALQITTVHSEWIIWISFAVVNISISLSLIVWICYSSIQLCICNLSLSVSTINSCTIHRISFHH